MSYTVKQFGTTEHTVRYCTDIGLLPCRRDGGNRRVFVVGSGRAEVGFTAGPVDAEAFDSEPFSSHRHVLVLGEGHKLAGRDSVSLADLNGRRIATLCGGYAPSKGILARLARSDVHPSETHWFAETYLGLMLAAEDDVACCPPTTRRHCSPGPTPWSSRSTSQTLPGTSTW